MDHIRENSLHYIYIVISPNYIAKFKKNEEKDKKNILWHDVRVHTKLIMISKLNLTSAWDSIFLTP